MKTYTEQELSELNAWIAEHVMGWAECKVYELGSTCGIESHFVIMGGIVHRWAPVDWPAFEPTTDPAASMLVLEKCLSKLGNDQSISLCLIDKGHNIMAVDNSFKIFAEADGSNLPLAICLFAKHLFSK